MHSSRMHTSRSLTISQSLLPGGGLLWGVWSQGEVSGPGGGGLVLMGSAPGGGLVPGGLLLGGGVSGGGISACTEADPTPC